MSDDPFPSEAFGALLRRLPRYARLAWAVGRDPALSRARRGAVLAGAAYLVSPIDLVPGIIPVLGQLDDLVVVLTTLRLALDGLSPARRQAHLVAVGLTDGDLTTDLRTTAAITAWLLRRAARLGKHFAVAGARGVGRGAAWFGRTAGHAAGRVGSGVSGAIANRRHGGEADPGDPDPD